MQQKPEPVRGRFAPSPTGRMHLGNIFCALLVWLAAKSEGGSVVLRFEDLDAVRCKRVYAQQLEEDLQWLGLTWDEGGLVPGYVQSEETAYLEGALARIAREAFVYPCYCSRSELHAASAPHLADGSVLYTGRCRSLTPAQRAAYKGRRAALRLAVPDEVFSFTDGHMGAYAENLARQCGDFLLRRSDGVFAYQFAVVADDVRMRINQVVRGRDLMPSTARQLYLYRLLGAQPPRYYHIPMLCARDGRRLSKRESDLDMSVLRRQYTPERLVGYLASLAGLVPEGAACTPQMLLPVFSWQKVPRRDILLEV